MRKELKVLSLEAFVCDTTTVYDILSHDFHRFAFTNRDCNITNSTTEHVASKIDLFMIPILNIDKTGRTSRLEFQPGAETLVCGTECDHSKMEAY